MFEERYIWRKFGLEILNKDKVFDNIIKRSLIINERYYGNNELRVNNKFVYLSMQINK